jgi:hypothetical protein
MAEAERAPELNYFAQKADRLQEAVEALRGELNATPFGDQRHEHSARLKDAANRPNDAVLRGKPPEV